MTRDLLGRRLEDTVSHSRLVCMLAMSVFKSPVGFISKRHVNGTRDHEDLHERVYQREKERGSVEELDEAEEGDLDERREGGRPAAPCETA